MCVHCGGSGYIDLSHPCPNCCAYSGESKAEGPATKEPEQSQPFALLEAYQAELVKRACDAIPSPSLPPGSPSGVVEARAYLEAIFSKREDSNPVVAEFLAANYDEQEPGFTKWAARKALTSLPQAPAEDGKK